MKETDVILKGIMLDLLTAESLEDAIDSVAVLLDSEQFSDVKSKADAINKRKKERKEKK